MDAGAGADHPDDIQAQILQTTLSEIESSRQNAAEPGGGGPAELPDCCVICLDAISDPCAALPCAHAHFDFLCILSWLEQRATCPLCKASVYKVRYTDVQRGESIYRVPNAPRTRNSAEGSEAAAETDIGFASSRGLEAIRRCGRRDLLRRNTTRAPPTADGAIQRRRRIYRHQLYSLHVGSNRVSRYRPAPTPALFSSTPHLVSRARLWIRRELQVFSFLSEDADSDSTRGSNPTTDRDRLRRRANAEFLLEYIIAILKTVDLQGSAGQAEAMLSDFLGRDHARLFLHELRCWLRSPSQSLTEWDREVQYPDPEEAGRSRRRRRDDDPQDNDVEEDQRGRSWRDHSGGDHWRADISVARKKRNLRR
ncbi:E3 ubiquitin-protein ligase ICP0 [Madurella mycetomatis]|uniref:RING-type E3 ubiquitin transferase n=1 Tax=Madurella mycetomatis TaxID=100816 RepID=A0A175VU41_9PEZI|nr:E3 ubiquitin-protein ligase ICP0 [Madurella mycetomatis]KXX76366.1 E3 ubiquitin-protein ligase ICP0 [Madurella mycetomatis]